MNHRFIEILAPTALVDEQVIEVDLDMADPISELILNCAVVNGADAQTTEHNILCFKKIEITDGSEVIYSLDGPEMQALDIYHSGIHPRGGASTYLNTCTARYPIAISFGRYLWDEQLAFDPKKFRNPKLKVTFDLDLGGMNVSAGQLSVDAALFDEKVISPTGFLMTKEIKRWSIAATSHEYTDLPTDYPFRKLLLQGRLGDVTPDTIFDNIKLATDQDKKVILNDDFTNLMWGIGRENAYIRETWLGRGDAAVATQIHITPTYDVQSVGSTWMIHAKGQGIAVYLGDGGLLRYWGTVATNAVIHSAGWAPHGTLCIPFGKQDVIEDWFDVRGIGSLKLDVTSGNADAVQKLFVQQYRNY